MPIHARHYFSITGESCLVLFLFFYYFFFFPKVRRRPEPTCFSVVCDVDRLKWNVLQWIPHLSKITLKPRVNWHLFHIIDIDERKWIHPKRECTFLVLPIQCRVNTNNVGFGKFIDRGLVIYFVCELWCRQLYFTVSVSFEGGLSRLLRKQMSILQRLICLIRLAASSIPTFIYLLMYLLTYSFTHLCLDLVLFSPLQRHPPPPPHFVFLLSSLASISKISLQRREDNIH